MKIEIIEKFGIAREDGTDDKRLLYMMTANSAPKVPFKDAVTQEFNIAAYVLFKDVEKDKPILSILSDTNVVMSGDSKTIQQSLEELMDTFGADVITQKVTIIADTSKNNRTFLQLCLV